MADKEIRELVHELATALWETVCDLESLQDTFEEGSYAKEMRLYNRAMDWLVSQNEVIKPQ